MQGSQGGSQPGKRVSTTELPAPLPFYHLHDYASTGHPLIWPAHRQQTWDKDTLRPVTVKQLLDCQEVLQGGDTRIDDADVTRVSIVGDIRNISRQTTNTTFRIDDGTGVIEAKDWNDVEAPTHDEQGNALSGPRQAFELGQCVKVFGSLKMVNQRRHVGVAMMKRVDNRMELVHHLLEAAYVHAYFTRGPPETLNGGEAAGASQAQAGAGASAGPSVSDPRLNGASAAARKVYGVLANTESNEGLHLQVICAQTKLSLQQADQAVHELEGIGCAYPTTDEENWAALMA